MPVDQVPARPAAKKPDAAKVVRYHDFIDEKIESTRRMVKVVDLATALVELGVAVLLFLLLAVVVEHWMIHGGFPVAVRVLLFALLVAGCGYFAVRRLWPLCVHAINPVYAAQTIEHSSPTLKNGLINLLLFRQKRAEIPDAVYRTIEEHAAHGLVRAPLDTAVDRSELIRLGYVLIAIVAVVAGYKVLSPKDPFVAVERVLMPWADIVPASRVTISDIKPGTVTISRGEFLDVSADVRGLSDDDSVVLRFTTDDGQIVGRPMPLKRSSDGLRYSGRLTDDPTATNSASAGVARNLTYWLEAGDARSLDYPVTVVPAATILVEKIDYHFPAYTGYVDHTEEGVGDIRAIEGTRVTVHARANGVIQEANIDYDADGRNDLRMTSADTNAHASFDLALRESDRTTPMHASYVLRFTNDEGRSNNNPVKHSINVEPDLAPEAEIRLPQERLRDVRLDEQVTIEVAARDADFSVAGVRLLGKVGEKEVLTELLLKAPQKGQFIGKYIVTPKSLGLQAGDVLKYWAEADDNRTPKPNTFKTEEKSLRVVSPNPAQQPPPNQAEKNARQQGQQQPGESEAGKADSADGKQGQQSDAKRGNQQPPNGQQDQGQKNQGQQDQPENGQGQQQKGDNQQQGNQSGEGQPQGQQSKSDNQQKNQGQQGQGEGQQQNNGDAGAHQQSGEQHSGESASADGKQSDNQSDSKQQSGSQSQNGGQQDKQTGAGAAGSESSNSGAQPSGARPDSDQRNQKNNNAQQQPGESDAPVSSEGDNDAEAFNRIQKHMEQKGDLKKAEGNGRDGGGEKQENNPQTKDPNQKPQFSRDAKQSAQPDQQNTPPGESAGGNPASADGKQGDKKNAGEPKSQDQSKSQQPGNQSNDHSEGAGANTRNDDVTKNVKEPNGESDSADGKESPGGEQTSSKGSPGGGNEQQPQGSPNSQPGMKPKDKPEQAGSNGDKSNEQEPPAGANSKRESDSHGDEGGDKAGGGEEGGGQKSPHDGTGSAGANQSADKGAGQSGEKGKGDNSSEAGGDAKSQERTGAGDGKTPGKGTDQREGAGNQPGGKPSDNPFSRDAKQSANDAAKHEGEKGREGDGEKKDSQQNAKSPENGKQQNAKNGESAGGNATSADGKPSDAQQGEQSKQQGDQNKQQPNPDNNQSEPFSRDAKQSEQPQHSNDNNKDDNNANSGASGSSGQPGGAVNPQPSITGEAPAGDAANLDYARKQTDMVLGKLADQLNKKKVDDDLLKELGWSEADLKRFVERWQERKAAAEQNDEKGEIAKRELDDALRSLGLRRGELQQNAAPKDTMRDLREGYRGPVPNAYKERLKAYNQGVSRARQNGE